MKTTTIQSSVEQGPGLGDRLFKFFSILAALGLCGSLPSHSLAGPGGDETDSIQTWGDLVGFDLFPDPLADHRIYHHSWLSGPTAVYGKTNTLRAEFLSLGDPVPGTVEVKLEIWHLDPETNQWSPQPVVTQVRHADGSFVSAHWYDSISLDFSFGSLQPGEHFALLTIDPNGKHDEFLGAFAGKSFYFTVNQPVFSGFFNWGLSL